MNEQEYLKLSEVTERKFPNGMKLDSYQISLMHEILFTISRTTNLADTLKKHLIYGKEAQFNFFQSQEILPHLQMRSLNLSKDEIEFFHMVIGMFTEAGELVEIFSNFLFKNIPIDCVCVKEEIGDSDWYRAGILRQQNYINSDVWETNIAKLKARYGDKFDAYKALNRDLNAERNILEKE